MKRTLQHWNLNIILLLFKKQYTKKINISPTRVMGMATTQSFHGASLRRSSTSSPPVESSCVALVVFCEVHRLTKLKKSALKTKLAISTKMQSVVGVSCLWTWRTVVALFHVETNSVEIPHFQWDVRHVLKLGRFQTHSSEDW